MGRKQNKRRILCDDKQLPLLKVDVADNFLHRLTGLLFRAQLKEDEGLLISPCNSIHTFFMRYSLDVVFLDENHRIIKLKQNVKPWHMSACRKARHVLELTGGAIARHSFNNGQHLCLDSQSVPENSRKELLAHEN